ncbi:MAG: cation-translocating P-type ATPase [Candidatus Microthrix sp.]|jgi:heavy metal translocating P-type ATPase|uniref:Putative Heavy metal translocating P-type ATPase n=1 Tax=Candidatus Neomicrothrix parvicella RN1 TaxID=1229780 RepID=R4Z735_9ACTN|nr:MULTISPECIES: cation-translocating P-type ATPase [Microthrix]MBK6501500.1 cation-translocating P-type ATPase [Candidatus Microthrix sp.]MBK7020136.1 cation-translocating P-type ATPase [Candidatus Microthrix sp.]MBP9065980.1 cation-translocating P-type ATPase [Candidatus Microthrix sp.]CCM65062.1 putative Heavy metal translocating P-type ATPase [Candidatus Microthrix parvicella RN1]
MNSATADLADVDVDDGVEHPWESREVRWSALAGLLLAVGFLAGRVEVPTGVVTGIYAASTVAGLRFFALEAIEELWRERRIGIELLMTVGTLAAGGLGEWGEAATLAFLYSISEALEEFTEDRTRNAIRALMDLAPKQVTRVRDGVQEEIDVGDLAIGDQFLVRPGEGVGTDGTIVDGYSALNEAAITGESVPVEKQVGDKVFAGTLNTTGAVVVEATATAEDNTLAKIVHLVSEAQEQKGRGEQFMSRFARIYSPAVLLVGVLVAFGGGMLTGDWSEWVGRAATVIVAAAPCALVISIPISYVAAIGNASRKGILIKGGIYLEELARLTALAMDKTGTITQGEPRVVDVVPADGHDERSVLTAAAVVEQRSEHPLASAVMVRSAELDLSIPSSETFETLVGAGARASSNGRLYLVGSPALMDDRGLALDGLRGQIENLERAGRTAIVAAVDDRVVGVVGIADVVRPQARDAISELRRNGVDHIVMLTGDNARTGEAIASEVGIDDVRAHLKPEDKSRLVAELAAHGHVGMVGDGVNDAPALAAASVGIAMGTAGSDVALETADVALMADDLSKLTEAVRIGRRTRRIVAQNIALGLVIPAILVPGALIGVFTLPIAVLAHELSELAVIANGLRLARR